MDVMINGFDDREFTADELTESMNVIPNAYGFVTQLGIFPPPRPLSTTFFRLEIKNWSLNLLPLTERGGPPTKGSVGKRTLHTFEIPNISHEDSVQVSEIQNLRAFGSHAPEQLENVINDKIRTMAGKHFLTHEFQRLTMLKGKLVDADATEVLNLYTVFGVTEPVVALLQSGSTITAQIRALKRYYETHLFGETMSRILALCSPGLMETLFADSELKADYRAAMAAHQVMVNANPGLADRRFSYIVQGVEFTEYNGTFSYLAADGTTTSIPAVAANECRFIPLGTMDCFGQYMAPGDFAEAVNMPGQLFYAKEERGRYNRSRDVLTQSNLLPLAKRPQLLVKGTILTSGTTFNASGVNL